jgi:hypothetical protein
MSQALTIKFEAKRLEEDLSNLHDFAVFVNGGIELENDGDDEFMIVVLEDDKTVIWAGDYALKFEDGTVEKWTAEKFERLFSL